MSDDVTKLLSALLRAWQTCCGSQRKGNEFLPSQTELYRGPTFGASEGNSVFSRWERREGHSKQRNSICKGAEI